MTRRAPAAPWGAVIAFLLVVALGIWAFWSYTVKVTECEEHMGGTLISDRSGYQCIKDGRIVIIWHMGTKVVNP